MEFGLNFFPTESPDETPAGDYFTECLDLAAQADELGYDHVRIVEHHFHRYGGYSPNPLVFLAAAAQRTRDIRLITGAVLPAFIHPLRLAGEVGMVDALSGGRLEVGFGRAFLPGEFARFGVSLDESRARFEEGITTVARLLEEEDVTSDGPFHPFPESTTLPRPTQSPRPPFWVAAVGNPTSFGRAGEMGHGVMAIPLAGPMMKGMLDVYREAWASAGHPGAGRVMLAFHMYCEEDGDHARSVARGPIEHHLHTLADAAADWVGGTSSADYPGYDMLFKQIQAETFEGTVAKGGAWVGSPDEIVEQALAYHESQNGFEVASLQVNFPGLAPDAARRSLDLFTTEVLPKLRGLAGGEVPTP